RAPAQPAFGSFTTNAATTNSMAKSRPTQRPARPTSSNTPPTSSSRAMNGPVTPGTGMPILAKFDATVGKPLATLPQPAFRRMSPITTRTVATPHPGSNDRQIAMRRLRDQRAMLPCVHGSRRARARARARGDRHGGGAPAVVRADEAGRARSFLPARRPPAGGRRPGTQPSRTPALGRALPPAP